MHTCDDCFCLFLSMCVCVCVDMCVCSFVSVCISILPYVNKDIQPEKKLEEVSVSSNDLRIDMSQLDDFLLHSILNK